MEHVFVVCQVGDYRSILRLGSRPLALLSYKAFLKNKKRSEKIFPASFSEWFLKKNSFIVMFYYLINFHCLVALLYKILGNMYIVTVC